MKIKIKPAALRPTEQLRIASRESGHYVPKKFNGSVETEPWIRLPKPKARLYGLSRTTLLELCESGAIKSTVLRKRYALRGIRLLCLPSLLAFLEQNSTGGSAGAACNTGKSG